MLSPRPISHIESSDLKSLILKKLGRVKADKYFHFLKRLLSMKITKLEFDKLFATTIGKENVALHNLLIRTILRNACFPHSAPDKQTNTGFSRNSKIPNGYSSDAPLASPRKGRSVNSCDRRFRDRLSPLGPSAMIHTVSTHEISNSFDPQRPQELISIGSKAFLEVGSVEDGEEVEQAGGSPGVQSRSPVRAPFGISTSVGDVCCKRYSTGFRSGFHLPSPDVPETCFKCCKLPDAKGLRKRMESKLEHEGLNLSVGCVNVLNTALDTYLKRMIKPCIELARARCNNELLNAASGGLIPGSGAIQREHLQKSNSCSASLLDFRVAMELNPRLLGEDWPVQLEKICLSEGK